MIGWLLALALSFVAPAHAQCNGIFGAGQACGSVSGGPPTQVPFGTIASGAAVTPVTSYGWKCDSIDHSTQAQNAINAVSATGGGTLFFPACPIATFTASLSGTNMTVSGVTGTIVIGSIVYGDSIKPNQGGSIADKYTPRTTIVSQTSGTPGGAGVYVISQAGNGSGGQVGSQPCYRADSQLTVPNYATATTQIPSGPSIRFMGPGGGAGLNTFSIAGNNANSTSACIDLRDASHVQMSGVGATKAGGSGYTSGTAMQTLTLSGGAGPISALSITTPGSGGTPGTYNNVWLLGTSGGLHATGSGARATIVVGAGGTVTSVDVSAHPGVGYSANDLIGTAGFSSATPAGVPTNAQFTVTSVTSSFTCSTAPTWKVVVSGGVVQGGGQPAVSPGAGIASSIGVLNAGSCTVVPNNPVTVTSTDGGTGATFNVYWTGGKLFSEGGGQIEIDHLTIVDGSPTASSEAMVYATNTVMNIHDNQFACSNDQNQDAIVFGGLLGSGFIVPPNNTADSASLGFGSIVNHNIIDGCNRWVFARTFNAQTTVTNNLSDSPAGDRIIEVLSAQFSSLYPYIANNYSEGGRYQRFLVVLNESSNGNYIGNSAIDIQSLSPSYQYDYYIQDVFGAGGFNNFVLAQGCFDQTTALPMCATFNTAAILNANIIGNVAGMLNFATVGNTKNSFGSWFQLPLANIQYTSAKCPSGFAMLGNSEGLYTYLASDDSNSRSILDITDTACRTDGNAGTLAIGISNNPVTFGSYNNASSTGTTADKLAKLTGAPSTAVITTAGDTSGAIGIAKSGAGTTGTVNVASVGIAYCTFDGATTAGDYVQISASVNGDCTDGGASYPSSGQVLGRVLSTNGGGGRYLMSVQIGPASGGSGLTVNTTTISGGAAGDILYTDGSKLQASLATTTAAGRVISPVSYSAAAPAFTIGTNDGFASSGGNIFTVTAGASRMVVSGSNGTTISAGLGYTWSSGAVDATSVDTGISRDSAGVVDVGNGTAADHSGTIQSAHATFTGLTTGTNADFLCLSSGGVVLIQNSACTISSLRFKPDWKPYDSNALSKVSAMDVGTFHNNVESRDPNSRNLQAGLNAENIAKIAPECAVYEDDGITPKSYRQECVIALLVKAIQQLQSK